MKFDKSKWVGKTFVCKDTSRKVTLTEDMVYPRAFIGIGNGAIDLGDGYYARWIGNIVEVTDEGCDSEEHY